MKVGKTTIASQFDHVLIAAMEPGTNALNNVYVQPVQTWDNWKQVVRQLTKNEELKERFHTIAIDVVDIAYALCEKWVCGQHGVEQLKEIPYGAGYKEVDMEFEGSFRDLMFAGYGLVFISHETEREKIRDNGETYNQIVPSMSKRCSAIVNGLVDIIGYLKSSDIIDENGNRKNQRSIYLVGDDRFLAGSRFQPIAPKIDMTYDALVNAIYDAIEKTAAKDGTEISDAPNPFAVLDFDVLMEDAKILWGQVVQQSKVPQANEILNSIFGKPTKFSEILPADVSKLNQAITEIKSIL